MKRLIGLYSIRDVPEEELDAFLKAVADDIELEIEAMDSEELKTPSVEQVREVPSELETATRQH